MKSKNIANMIATAKRRGKCTKGNVRVDCFDDGGIAFTLYSTVIVRVYREKNRRRIKFNASNYSGDFPNYWNTSTTRKNMNAICEALGFDGRVSSKDGALHAIAGGVRLWADDVGGMDFPFPIVKVKAAN